MREGRHPAAQKIRGGRAAEDVWADSFHLPIHWSSTGPHSFDTQPWYKGSMQLRLQLAEGRVSPLSDLGNRHDSHTEANFLTKEVELKLKKNSDGCLAGGNFSLSMRKSLLYADDKAGG